MRSITTRMRSARMPATYPLCPSVFLTPRCGALHHAMLENRLEPKYAETLGMYCGSSKLEQL